MSPQDFLSTASVVLAVMGVAAAIELAVPLYAGSSAHGPRRRTNLAMTMQTLLFAYVLTSVVALAAVAAPVASPGLMAAAGLPAPAQFFAGIVALDFAFGYVAHRSMHAWPALWKYHRVHHSDEFVDVTTSYRTHPVESVWRHVWLFATVWVLGVPATAVVAYRVLSGVNGILEHANIRVSPVLDAALARVWVTPNMHKVHHSRDQKETDSNYGNLFTLHDRLLGTFTPTERAFSVEYGLDGVEPAEIRSFGALLAMPWRPATRRRRESRALEVAA